MNYNSQYKRFDGMYYGNHVLKQCIHFERCIMCGGCRNYSASMHKCKKCHSNHAPVCSCDQNTAAVHNYVRRKMHTDSVVPDRNFKNAKFAQPPGMPSGIKVDRTEG